MKTINNIKKHLKYLLILLMGFYSQSLGFYAQMAETVVSSLLACAKAITIGACLLIGNKEQSIEQLPLGIIPFPQNVPVQTRNCSDTTFDAYEFRKLSEIKSEQDIEKIIALFDILEQKKAHEIDLHVNISPIPGIVPLPGQTIPTKNEQSIKTSVFAPQSKRKDLTIDFASMLIEIAAQAHPKTSTEEFSNLEKKLNKITTSSALHSKIYAAARELQSEQFTFEIHKSNQHLQDSITNRYEMAARTQQLITIISDQKIAQSILNKIQEAERLFTQAASYSNNSEAIEAQVNIVLNPPQLPGFLQEFADGAREQLLNILLDRNGSFQGIFEKSKFEQAQGAIKSLNQVNKHLKALINGVLSKNLKTIDLRTITTLDPDPQTVFQAWKNGLSGMIGRRIDSKKARELFINNRWNKNLVECLYHIKKKNFSYANAHLDILTPAFSSYIKTPEQSTYEVIKNHYHKEYDKAYDAYGIQKKYSSDPEQAKFVERIKKTRNHEEREKIQSAAEIQLGIREACANQFLKHINLTIEKTPIAIKNEIYTLLTIGDDPFTIREYLCSLSADHPNAQKREAYHHFFDKEGMLLLYPYEKSNLLGIQVSDSIHLAESQELRLLRNQLVTIAQPNKEVKEQVKRGLIDIQSALKNIRLKEEYTYLAKKDIKQL